MIAASMKSIPINEFIQKCGFHDNRITGICISELEMRIYLDDVYANIHNNNEANVPGCIVISTPCGLMADGIISNWIVDGSVAKDKGRIGIILYLNTGTILTAYGSYVFINIESGQQVDSAEPSTIAVPPSSPSGSAR